MVVRQRSALQDFPSRTVRAAGGHPGFDVFRPPKRLAANTNRLRYASHRMPGAPCPLCCPDHRRSLARSEKQWGRSCACLRLTICRPSIRRRCLHHTRITKRPHVAHGPLLWIAWSIRVQSISMAGIMLTRKHDPLYVYLRQIVLRWPKNILRPPNRRRDRAGRKSICPFGWWSSDDCGVRDGSRRSS